MFRSHWQSFISASVNIALSKVLTKAPNCSRSLSWCCFICLRPNSALLCPESNTKSHRLIHSTNVFSALVILNFVTNALTAKQSIKHELQVDSGIRCARLPWETTLAMAYMLRNHHIDMFIHRRL